MLNKNIKLLYDLYPILKRINDKNEGIITDKAQFRILNAEEYISSVRGTCQGILFVVKGNINVKKINENGDETNLYNIADGEICHEAISCLLQYKKLNIIGTAIQKSTICIIPVDIVKKYILTDSEFLSYIYKDIYEKLNLIIEKRDEKNHKSIEERIISYLLKQNGNIIYATHREIAYEIDSKREVVSRNLKKLEKEGTIKLERGKIILLKNLNNVVK